MNKTTTTIKLTPQDKLVILPRKYKFKSLKELILVKLNPKLRSNNNNDGPRNLSLDIGDLPSQTKKKEDCFIRDGSLYGKKRKREERFSEDDAPNYKKKVQVGRETVMKDIKEAKKEIKKLEDEVYDANLLDSDLKYRVMFRMEMMKKMKDKIQKAFDVLKKKINQEETNMKKMLNEIKDTKIEQSS